MKYLLVIFQLRSQLKLLFFFKYKVNIEIDIDCYDWLCFRFCSGSFNKSQKCWRWLNLYQPDTINVWTVYHKARALGVWATNSDRYRCEQYLPSGKSVKSFRNTSGLGLLRPMSSHHISVMTFLMSSIFLHTPDLSLHVSLVLMYYFFRTGRDEALLIGSRWVQCA